MEVTHILCGAARWAHPAVVIDADDHELVDNELARRGRAGEAERAVEAACIRCAAPLPPSGGTPVVRSDNGLIFESRRLGAASNDYRLSQEFITTHTPYRPDDRTLLSEGLSP